MQNEWISVKDRLPEKNGYYICWYRASKCGNKEDWKIKLLYWEDNIWLLDHRGFNVVDIVTHWMLLPKAPKGE